MTKASDNLYPKVILEEVANDGSATDTPAADHRALFLGEDGLLHLKDSAAAVTGVSGVADQGAFTYLDATEAAAPSTPGAGKARIYAKSDGRIYSKDDAGTEFGPFDAAGAGAGGPLLNVDDLALHGSGDEFTDPDLGAWTLGGALTTADTTAVGTEPYDASCVDIVFGAQGDRMYKSVPTPVSGDYEVYLTWHGVTNGTPDSHAALGAMLAVYFSDNSGNGTGFSCYNDNKAYLWVLAANAYSSSGPSVGVALGTSVQPPEGYAAANCPLVYRLRKVGTTITGALSHDGGIRFVTASRTDATAFTRMGIIRAFSGGGTNPTLRVGRFNVVEL